MKDVGQFDDLIRYVLKHAAKLQDDAGHSGAMSDYGASALRDEVAAFRAGLDGRIPEKWKGHAENLKRETDPEYAEYLRLKKKFEAKS